MKEDILKYILGDIPIPQVIACVILAFVGILIRLFYGVIKRQPLDERTPIHFSWRFFLSDNFTRIISSMFLTLLGVPIIIIFSEQILQLKLNPFLGLIIGFSFDSIIGKLVNFTPDSTLQIKNKQMTEEFYWGLEFSSADDKVITENDGDVPLGGFADMTSGVLTDLEIAYDIEPTFESVLIIKIDATTYSSAPIKKPRKPY